MFSTASSDPIKEELKTKEQLLKELKILRAQLAILEEEKVARKKAEEETDLLKSLIIAISEVPDLNSALAIALKKVCEATGWVVGQAWVLNSEGTYLISSPAWYTKENELEQFRSFNKDLKFNPGVGLPGRVWVSKHPIWIRDILSDNNTARTFLPGEIGLKAGLAVPILSKNNEVIAVIEFFMYEAREVDAHLVSLISAVAAQLGTVIERRKVEDEFRKVQERFIGIYNSSKDAIGYCNMEGFFIDVNDSFVKLVGYEKSELLSGKKYQNITPVEYHDNDYQIKQKILATGEPVEHEKEYIRKDGSRIPILVTAFLVRDKNNVPIGFAGIVKDITEHKKSREALKSLNESLERKVEERTRELVKINNEIQSEISERKRMENALRESEEKYKRLIEAANDAIFIADAETGVIIGANKKAGILLDLDVEEIIGMHQSQLHPKEESELYKNAFIEHVKSGEAISDELVVCDKHGERIPVEISASVIEVGGKKIIQGIFRDLRKWKQAHNK